MSEHVVIGTAGHVDHGKTALVKLLTGVDTDRWEEERRRGITIDLGFAPLTLGDGLAASIVDVPGHEDFVRNMVAGATGVDVALLVVAADESVMPQTEEHLAILEFLGVRAGVLAITKTDLVGAEWLELVVAELAQRLDRSAIQWEPPVPCSVVTGVGREELMGALARAAQRAAARSSDDLFRMPIDRVFSVAGAGTVVTGSTWSGSVTVGQQVQILPAGVSARVRSVQVHGEPRERAEPGRRTALALVGADKDAICRGDVALVGDGWRSTTVVDVMIVLLPGTRPLTQRSRLRLHLGTAEVLARVTPAAAGAIAAGETASARLRLERQIVARWGDRGILRSYSPMTTVGGCVVVDPWPAPRPRRPAELAPLAATDPVERLAAWVTRAGPQGVALSDLPVRLGIPPGAVKQTVAAASRDGITRVGEWLVAGPIFQVVRRAILDALAGYHAERPLEPGMPWEALRGAVRAPHLAHRITEQLAADGGVVLEAGRARLAGHQPRLSDAERAALRRLEDALEAAGFRGLSGDEARSAVAADVPIEAMLEHLVRGGTVRRLSNERYYSPHALERAAQVVVAEVRQRGGATPAELRVATGLTRQYLIPLLQWLDAEGHTVRDGDVRRLGPAA